MTFAQPWWALLIVPLLLVVVVRERRLTASAGLRRARIGLRALVLVLLALALARPSLTWTSHGTRRLVVAVDRSAALDAAARTEARQVIEASLNDGASEEALGLSFSQEVTAPFGLRQALEAGWPSAPVTAPGAAPTAGGTAPPAPPEPAAAATARVAPALAAARALFAPGESGRVLALVSASAELAGLEELADELAARGLTLDLRVLPGPTPKDAAPVARVKRLTTPTSVVRGAFEVRADVEGPRGSVARLLADGRVLAEVPVPDPDTTQPGPAAREVLFEGLELPPGRHLLALTLVPATTSETPGKEGEQGALPELALAEVQVEGRPRVVMVLTDPERDPLRRAASAQGFDVEALAAGDLSARLKTGAAGFHALALDARSAAALGAEVQRTVVQRVEEGLGLFLAAGDDAASWASLAGSPLGALLPLEPLAPLPVAPPTPRPPPPKPPPEPDEPEPAPGPGLKAERQPEEALPIALLLVLDRSASMQGLPWAMAVEAAERAAQVLSPYDRIGVVTFAEEARIELAMGPVLTAGSVALHLPPEATGRGTNLVAGLRMAAEVMRNERAPIRHVLFLTDGYHNPTGTHAEQALWSEVVKPLARLGVTLTAVGLGEGHDATTLKQIRSWVPRGHYRAANRPDQVPTVFIVDTQSIAQARSKEARARLPDPEARPTPQETPPPAPTPETPPPEPPSPPTEGPYAPPPEPGPTERLEPLRLGTPHPALKGFRDADLPKVEAPARAGPRPAGLVALARGEAQPVLGARRYGLGRVLAWTGRPKDPWLSSWPELARLFGQSLRSLLAPEGTFGQQARLRVLATAQGDRLEPLGLAEAANAPWSLGWRADGPAKDLGTLDPTRADGGFDLPAGPRGSLAHLTLTDARGQAVGALTYVVGTAQGPADPEAARAEVAHLLADGRPAASVPLRETRVSLAGWLLLLALLLLPWDAWLHREPSAVAPRARVAPAPAPATPGVTS